MLLEKLLDGLEVRVKSFAVCAVAGGESLPLDPAELPTVHYCLAGRGRIALGAAAPRPFARHGFIIVPPGQRVRIFAEQTPDAAAPPRGQCESVKGGLLYLNSGAGAPDVVMACGRITATYQGARGLFDHLREPLFDDFACADGVCRPFEMLLAELADPRPGTLALADALMQQCLMLLLRRYCAGGECRLPWLSALEDPRLGRVLADMLAHPERDFTLDGLAEMAGMSRSAFAAHFSAAFGRPPIEFLKELRLRRAAQLLRSTDLPVKSVGPRVGFASRSYFSRAFKAHFGIDPLTYRRGGGAVAA